MNNSCEKSVRSVSSIRIRCIKIFARNIYLLYNLANVTDAFTFISIPWNVFHRCWKQLRFVNLFRYFRCFRVIESSEKINERGQGAGEGGESILLGIIARPSYYLFVFPLKLSCQRDESTWINNMLLLCRHTAVCQLCQYCWESFDMALQGFRHRIAASKLFPI